MAPFGIIFVPLLVVALAIAALIRRARPRLPWPAAIAALGTILFLFSRAANPWLVPFFILIFAILLGAAAAIGWPLGRWVPRPLAAAACFVALFLAGRHLPVPVPAVPRGGNAASSLHATAGDLARFLIAAADSS